MKFFPSNIYEFKLIDNQNITIERLNKRTLNSERLISKITDKSFIGKVDENQFKIISSDVGKGAFCILSGKINQRHVEVNVEINKPIKILLSILMFSPIIGLFIELIKKSLEFNPILLLVCFVQILIIRFILIEMAYKFLSKQSINKLSDVLDTEWIKKNK